MKTKDFRNEELSEYFAEHVRYEVQSLLNAAYAILKQLPIIHGLHYMPVESFAIHLRNLITFLYPFTPRQNDVCAKDFFIDEDRWSKLRPELSTVLAKAKDRADKEVGHLTTARQYGTPKEKEWDVKGLVEELMPLFQLFCESADKIELEPLMEGILTYYSKVKLL